MDISTKAENLFGKLSENEFTRYFQLLSLSALAKMPNEVNNMISEEVLLEKIKVLPPNLKQKAIDYVESLQSEVVPAQKRKSLKGSLAHLNIKLSEQDLRKARNEMWRGYTKDTENEK